MDLSTGQTTEYMIADTQACGGLVFLLSIVTFNNGHPSHHKIPKGGKNLNQQDVRNQKSVDLCLKGLEKSSKD